MSSGVDLSEFDWDSMHARAVENERILYQKVIDNRDEAAAASLVAIYAACSQMSAPEVQEAIEDGARQVMLDVVERSSLPGASATVNPLHFFGMKGKTGPDGAKMTALINLRRALEFWLTEKDLRIALTRDYLRPSKLRTKSLEKLQPESRDDWPETVAEVEIALVDYVCHRLFKDADKDVARAYVQESFHWVPWEKREEPVIYPTSW